MIAQYIDGDANNHKTWIKTAGLPIGSHFRVNLVESGHEDMILAQSNEFTIFKY